MPKELARIACEMQGCTLTELRENTMLLGYFCAALKDAGTLYERIAGAVNERERGKPTKSWVTPKGVEALCKQVRGTSAARSWAADLAQMAYDDAQEYAAAAARMASASAAKGLATKRSKNPVRRG